jgi:TPR repeat protein
MGAKTWVTVLAAVLPLCGADARADLYQASAAVAKQDLPRAFELYRELAELGHPLAQEMLAAMYVNGEGVKRDNVLGYAWAKLALENGGGGESARSIVEQIEPHLKEAARARIADLHARFGTEALRRSLLPREAVPEPTVAGKTACKMISPADPAKFYPPEAYEKKVAGTVVIDARVLPDGSARLPRVLYSFPPGAFDAPARAVALSSGYKPVIENGVAVPCTIRFRVKFTHHGAAEQFTDEASMQLLARLRSEAVAGDSNSQLLYALIMTVRPAPDPEPSTTSRWLLRSAQAGVPAAQYLVGERLMTGGEWARDEAKAARWLEMAGSRGNGDASTALATYLLRPAHDAAMREKGFTWMQRAAEARHFEGRLFFAALLASWPDASKRDPVRALALLDELGKEFEYDPLSFEIRAAALAAQGKFKEAIAAQKRAVSKARARDWEVGKQQLRLDAYQQGRLPDEELVRF